MKKEHFSLVYIRSYNNAVPSEGETKCYYLSDLKFLTLQKETLLSCSEKFAFQHLRHFILAHSHTRCSLQKRFVLFPLFLSFEVGRIHTRVNNFYKASHFLLCPTFLNSRRYASRELFGHNMKWPAFGLTCITSTGRGLGAYRSKNVTF